MFCRDAKGDTEVTRWALSDKWDTCSRAHHTAVRVMGGLGHNCGYTSPRFCPSPEQHTVQIWSIASCFHQETVCPSDGRGWWQLLPLFCQRTSAGVMEDLCTGNCYMTSGSCRYRKVPSLTFSAKWFKIVFWGHWTRSTSVLVQCGFLVDHGNTCLFHSWNTESPE